TTTEPTRRPPHTTTTLRTNRETLDARWEVRGKKDAAARHRRGSSAPPFGAGWRRSLTAIGCVPETEVCRSADFCVSYIPDIAVVRHFPADWPRCRGTRWR